MKTMTGIISVAALAMLAGCQSSAQQGAYANPLDACASIEDKADREACVRNVVADVALSTQREKERRRGP